jgi:hypothetical protein
MFLLVVVLYQKKHGQAIQRPKETLTDNTKTKRNMDRQYNDQKKPVHVSFGRCIVSPCFFWSLYCLSMFLLIFVLPVHVSFGRCIVCPCFIQRPKEAWTDNTTTNRNTDRQYNDQKKHGQEYKDLSMFLLVVVLPVHVSCMFLLVVVLSVHVSFGRYKRPTETRTDNTTTKRNMERQYKDQKKHGQTIQRPKET